MSQNEIVSETNYYPFGLQHKGYNEQTTSNNLGENWKFNGKELNDEFGLNFTDFGWRNYMSDIGRWISPDPLMEEYPEWSPYNFTMNNPVRFTDVDGLYSTDEWMRDNGITDDDLIKVEDIIFLNNDNKEIGRIILPGSDVTVQVDTDLSPQTPFEIDPSIDPNIDAVGFNVEGSITVGGGMHAGIGGVYFLNGKNEGELHFYDFVGGNVGIGAGLGISAYSSVFNKDKANKNFFGVGGFEGKYNGYTGSIIAEGSYIWSNENNTSNELWPSMKSPWTWKSISAGFGGGTQADIRFIMGKTKNFKKINLN